MRVFLGLRSIAGVEWEYRNGLRKMGVNANVILRTAHPFGYPYDRILCEKGFASSYRSLFYSAINLPSFLKRYDIFHFSYGSSLLPFNIDVPVLKKMKKGIVMTFLGSDIRCSRLVLEGLLESKNCNYCRQNPCPLEEKVKRVIFWGRNADVIFSGVEMSDLLDFYGVPYHQFVLPIDLDHWKPFEPGPEFSKKDNEVLIVHAPSSQMRKGTPTIMDAVNKLKKVYPIKIKLLTDVPNHLVREWLNAADIVVDQISVGWHGKLSVESMALGKPTLCYINEEYKERFSQFRELPIVNITSDNLSDQLESLIIDENLRKEIGKKSRLYAERVHDRDIICRDLLKIYENMVKK